MPPLEFDYSRPKLDPTIRAADRDSLSDLPERVDGARFRWLDLDGEGLSGILYPTPDAWYYKRNVSPLTLAFDGEQPTISARFEALVSVATLPGFARDNAVRHQFLDLAERNTVAEGVVASTWSDVAWTGHTGGHYGAYSAAFLHVYVFPLIAAAR